MWIVRRNGALRRARAVGVFDPVVQCEAAAFVAVVQRAEHACLLVLLACAPRTTQNTISQSHTVTHTAIPHCLPGERGMERQFAP